MRISADLRVQITRDMPALPAAIEDAVEATWHAALRANPHLFNGRIFSADHLDTRRIDGHFTDYSRLVAQINRPDLAASLALRPLAVCGVTVFWQDGQRAVLFGQRSDRTSYQQGLWQLPPAGSIDAKAIDPDGSVDVRRALLTELHEEVGVPPDAVRVITPLCIVEHPETNVTDLGFALHTDWSAEAVLAAQARTGDTEYSSVQVVTLEDSERWLAEMGARVVPSAGRFLDIVRREPEGKQAVLF
jgi:8-oxo-dGTP pyrophosphatase MutT (NUDIX family)